MARIGVGIRRPRRAKKATFNIGYRAYELVHRLRYPGVAYLTPRAYRRQPLRAWEAAFGLGVKRRGVVHRIRRRKRRLGGISGLF